MAIGMFLDWQDVTSEQYDKIRAAVDWDRDVPDGLLFHVATFDQEGAHFFDFWESAAAFQSFVGGRMMPAVQEVGGIDKEPSVRIFDVHATFTPGFRRI